MCYARQSEFLLWNALLIRIGLTLRLLTQNGTFQGECTLPRYRAKRIAMGLYSPEWLALLCHSSTRSVKKLLPSRSSISTLQMSLS